jgi:hypothetical protein
VYDKRLNRIKGLYRGFGLDYTLGTDPINTFIVVLPINHKPLQVNDTGNYLVVGAGLAGLSFALRASGKGRVTVLSKTDLMDSNSSKAQGGIAAVQRLPDSFKKHVGDTLHVGQGLGDRGVVELMVR